MCDDGVMGNIPREAGQVLDHEVGQVTKDCLSDNVIVRRIFQYFSNPDLLKLSCVSKLWNNEARILMKKRGNLFAHVRCTDNTNESCQENVEAFLAASRQMKIVPFSGINLHLEHYRATHAFHKKVPHPLHDIILDQLQLKKFSVDLIEESEDCPAFLLAKKVFQDFSEVMEELSVHIQGEYQKYVQVVLQECRFPRLKILKLRERYFDLDVDYSLNRKELVSRAPTLQEVHTDKPRELVLKALEGSSAVIVNMSTG